MLTSPRFPARHPDRHIDCQEILEDRVITIVDDARAAGWSMEEIAVALVELADNMVLGHRANVNLEAALIAAETMVGGGTSIDRGTVRRSLVLDWKPLLTSPDDANE